MLFPGALGDFMCWLPSVIALRAQHAGPMLMIAKPALLELLQLRNVTGVSIDRREVADLFALDTRIADETVALFGGFNRVYSWTGFGHDQFTRRLHAVAGGRVEVFPFRGMQPGEHAVDYYARCLDVSASPWASNTLCEDDAWVTDFMRRYHLDNRPILVVHPGSGSPKKNWQGCALLVRAWRDRHNDAVVWVEGPAEVERPIPTPDGAIGIDRLSLPQLAALLHRAGCYLGNDSGVSHLAAALGRRGVVLFASTDPGVWAPRGKTLQVLHAADPCVRCGVDAFCTHRLTIEKVLQTLEEHRASAET